MEKKHFKIALAGNPNCGKTVIFNNLTGGKQRIGNWPGVTVEKKEGTFYYNDAKYIITDLPGIYALSAFSDDERVTRDFLLTEETDLVVNVIDATNVERNLYLTTQLLEMGVPVIIILNMMDLAKKRNIHYELEHFEKHIDCPVIAASAINKLDMEKIKAAIEEHATNPKISSANISYANEIEDELKTLTEKLSKISEPTHVNKRWMAVKIIENDSWAVSRAIKDKCVTSEEVQNIQKHISRILGDEPDILIADYRYGFIHGLVRDTVKRKHAKKEISENIDKVVLNTFMGIPIFLGVMYVVFWVTMNFGGAFIDFFDILFGTIFVDGLSSLLSWMSAPEWLNALVSNGLGAGVQTVSTFIPIIFMMFFMLSMLEDSGYMARAAFVMDRFMRVIGLPGKSFVPMLVGFGCTVPAILSTRTLENKRDRMLTIVMTPFMSCGAKLPVFGLFAAAFFPGNPQNAVFGIYIIGIIFGLATLFMLRKTVFKGEPEPFVMELPPYHAPRLYHILLHTWGRLKTFLHKAGAIIIGMVLILGLLNSIGADGSFGNEDNRNSILSHMGKTITPIFEPMGITQDNWPATVSLFTGLFAKEAVIGTLNGLYGQMDTAEEGDEGFDFVGGIKDAFVSIPNNLMELGGSFADPVGIEVDADGQKEENTSLFYSLQNRFKSRSRAFAYMLFVLLYIPCIAAVGAVWKETGSLMTILLVLYLTILAWSAATVFYQIAEGGQMLWVMVPALVMGLIYFTLKIAGKRGGYASGD